MLNAHCGSIRRGPAITIAPTKNHCEPLLNIAGYILNSSDVINLSYSQSHIITISLLVLSHTTSRIKFIFQKVKFPPAHSLTDPSQLSTHMLKNHIIYTINKNNNKHTQSKTTIDRTAAFNRWSASFGLVGVCELWIE